MANNSKDDKTEPNDPREAVEAIGQQVYETLSKGFAEAFGFLQELSSTIEERIEEVFGDSANAKTSSSSDDVREATATKTPAKKTAAKQKTAPAAKKKTAAKKAAAKKPAAKKAAAKKTAAKKKAPAAKKKAAAKKAPAKKKAASSSPTRDELYAEAQELDIAGRSKMSKAQLQKAIAAAKK